MQDNSDLAELLGGNNLDLKVNTQSKSTAGRKRMTQDSKRHNTIELVDRLDNDTQFQNDTQMEIIQSTEFASSIQSPMIEKIQMVPRGYH